MTHDSVSAFKDLATPESGAGSPRLFSTLTIAPGLRLAKGANGHAAFLVAGVIGIRAPIVTRLLRADFDAQCEVIEGASTIAETATVVECLSEDEAVVRYFLLAVTAVLASPNSAPPSPADARASINALIQLFRAMSQTPIKSVQGLWGELLLIASSDAPDRMIDAWHVSPQDRHDFAESGQRIEVKTVAGRHRRHRFAHEQLCEVDGDVVIVSVQVEHAADGLTVLELLARITNNRGVTNEQRLRLLEGVGACLGEDWQAAERHRYDAAAAVRSVLVFALPDVPALSEPIPAQITDVKYTVDLAMVRTIDDALLIQRGGIHAQVAAVRRR
jgi:hypothetical protein